MPDSPIDSIPRSRRAILAMLFVIFIDGMGIGILIPILTAALVNPETSFLDSGDTQSQRAFLYGLIYALFMLACFFACPILGTLSDRYGRKLVLMGCLLNAFLCYILTVFALSSASIILLIIARTLGGVSGASQPIAQAAIVDIVPPEKKRRSIGMILAAASVGFVSGPIAYGILSDDQIVSWFGFSIPIYFTCILSLLNALLLLFFFHEKRTGEKVAANTEGGLLKSIYTLFTDQRFKSLRLTFIAMAIGWNGFYGFVTLFLIEEFKYSDLFANLYLATISIAFTIGCSVLLKPIGKHLSDRNSILVGFMIAGACLILIVVLKMVVANWAAALVIGAAFGIGYTTLVTVFSNKVKESEQGWVMGMTESLFSLAIIISSLVFGYLDRFGAAWLMLVSGACMFAAAFFMTRARTAEN